MKTSLSVSIVGIAALILAQPVQAGWHGGGGRSSGGGGFSGGRSFGGGAHYSGGRSFGGGSHYAGPSRSFSASSMPSARFSSGAVYHNRAAGGSGPRYTGATRFRNPAYNGNGRQFGGNRTAAYNTVSNGRTRSGINRTNGGGSSGFNPNGRVIARHSANWRAGWNRNHDHNWHGHRCHFHNNFWYIYDPFPWYGYGYPYAWDYYPYGSYSDPGYYEEGAYADGAYSDNGQYSQEPNASGSRVSEVQRALARAGYYDGAIDGVLGAGTRRALRNYQRDHGLDATGGINQPLIESLRLR